MGRHRHTRPRYGRIAVASTSLAVTSVAVLGGIGVIGTVGPATAPAAEAAQAAHHPAVAETGRVGQPDTRTGGLAAARDRDRSVGRAVERAVAARGGAAYGATAEARTLPTRSGGGRRVVFSESAQRVWLVDAEEHVVDSWLVSGSLTDNLRPGTYEVWSRSEQAWGIDDSGTMRHFVRFAHGERAAIGFHDIPVDDGKPVQTVDQLGTPQSHGCIRQRRQDAVKMWDFAQLGTTVVVTA